MVDPTIKAKREHHRMVSEAAMAERDRELVDAWRDPVSHLGSDLEAFLDDVDRHPDGLAPHWADLPAFARPARRGRPSGHGSRMAKAVTYAAVLWNLRKIDHRSRTGHRRVSRQDGERMLVEAIDEAVALFGVDRPDVAGRENVANVGRRGGVIAWTRRLSERKSDNRS